MPLSAPSRSNWPIARATAVGMCSTDAIRLALTVPTRLLKFRQLALATQATARDVGEGRGPAHDLPPPVRVVGSVAEGLNHQVSALVDDSAPEFSTLPPPLIPGIGSQNQQGTHRNAQHLVRGHRDRHVRESRVLLDDRDQQCDRGRRPAYAARHRESPILRSCRSRSRIARAWRKASWVPRPADHQFTRADSIGLVDREAEIHYIVNLEHPSRPDPQVWRD